MLRRRMCLFVLLPTTGQVRHKAFLKCVRTQGCSPDASGKNPKITSATSPKAVTQMPGSKQTILGIYIYMPRSLMCHGNMIYLFYSFRSASYIVIIKILSSENILRNLKITQIPLIYFHFVYVDTVPYFISPLFRAPSNHSNYFMKSSFYFPDSLNI